MSAEFRQRTPGEYARIVWKRKWFIVLPAIAIFFAIALVVWRLADIYESTTLLTVRPAVISTGVVPPISDMDLTVRINNIGQTVTSRSSLQPLIERYHLYAAERASGEPMEALVDRMRKDIHIELNRSRNDVTNGFTITFRAREPRATQAVTAELASMYVNAQTRSMTIEADQTRQFFDQQLAQARTALEEVERRRLTYMTENSSSLPQHAQAMVGQLTGLREQQGRLTMEIGRLTDQQTILSNQASELVRQREAEIADVTQHMTDPRTTVAWGQLMQRKAEIEAELQNMLTRLRPANPEVVAKQNELASLQRQMDTMMREHDERVIARRRELEGRSDGRLVTLQGNLQFIQNERARQQRMLDQISAQIANIEQRLGQVPNSEVQLETLNREYQTIKTNYDQLQAQQRQANLASEVAANQQGESIQVIDPANLPGRPVAPNRPMLMLLGLGLGLGVGFACAGGFELRRLLTIQTTEDAEHYTGLPVLASVPELLTAHEERRRKMRRLMLAAASIIVTLISIPALALVLRFTRILETLAMRT